MQIAPFRLVVAVGLILLGMGAAEAMMVLPLPKATEQYAQDDRASKCETTD